MMTAAIKAMMRTTKGVKPKCTQKGQGHSQNDGKGYVVGGSETGGVGGTEG